MSVDMIMVLIPRLSCDGVVRQVWNVINVVRNDHFVYCQAPTPGLHISLNVEGQLKG